MRVSDKHKHKEPLPMNNQSHKKAAKRPWVLVVLLLILAVGFLVGGIKLALLGGSFYYLSAGLLILVTAVQLWRGRNNAQIWYAAMLLLTLVWAIYESGLDGWALAPRLCIPAGFGVWLSLPVISRWLKAQNLWPWSARGCLSLSVISVALLLVSALKPIEEPGVFPEAQIISTDKAVVESENGEWRHYGNTQAGTRFSPLTQITLDNIQQLEPAWTYRTGVVQQGETSHLQATPLMVNNSLYFCTQTNIVIALDPETGQEKWRYDPAVDPTGGSLVRTCRGVAYVELSDAADCPQRIISASFDSRLFALDANTGRPCESFGDQGFVDLKRGMGKVDAGFSYMSSAPVVVRNKIIVNGWIADNVSVGEPSGVIRAFDARTGEFAWAWDLGRPGEYGEPAPGETYARGTPNSWAPMSADDELGMVYVPTGNATPDHWGGHRTPEMDKYSTSIVALSAETGEPQWHFQTVHHDLWDYDVASQPTLLDLDIDGERVPVLLQPTKVGQVFMFDRRDGRLLADVEEMPVPQDPAKGDWMSPTQPVSTQMPSFSTEVLEEKDMWGITPFDQLWCRIFFRELRYEGRYTPVGSERASLIYPGVGGGMNWGGVSVDPERGVMLVNSLHIGSVIQLIPRDEQTGEAGKAQKLHATAGPAFGTPYSFYWNTYVSPLGVPCNEPAYGKMSAVDLRTKQVIWSVPLGTARDSGPFGTGFGLPLKMGVPNFGGSVTTRSGLVFIGATHEEAIRAFDIRTGEVVWKARLPAAGAATPMTYISPASGRQFIVIVAGGHRTMQAPLGDYVQAFAIN
jgi:quinoprotein glucose dehydrogenase/quinate dehydrogenase (quinone)